MLESHFESVVPELVKSITGPIRGLAADLLVADIDPGGKTREIDIDPIRIFRCFIKKARIPDHNGIYRVFEGIGIAGLIKGLVLMRRKINFEIAPPFGGINTITGEQQREYQKQEKGAG
jgi:hypothetical protein